MSAAALFQQRRGPAAGLGLYVAALLAGIVLADHTNNDAWYLHLALLFLPSVLAGAVLSELAFLGPPVAVAGPSRCTASGLLSWSSSPTLYGSSAQSSSQPANWLQWELALESGWESAQ